MLATNFIVLCFSGLWNKKSDRTTLSRCVISLNHFYLTVKTIEKIDLTKRHKGCSVSWFPGVRILAPGYGCAASAWLAAQQIRAGYLEWDGQRGGKNSGPVPSSTFNDRCDHAGVRRSRWKHFSVRTHAGLDTSPLNERVYVGSAKSIRKIEQRRGDRLLDRLNFTG